MNTNLCCTLFKTVSSKGWFHHKGEDPLRVATKLAWYRFTAMSTVYNATASMDPKLLPTSPILFQKPFWHKEEITLGGRFLKRKNERVSTINTWQELICAENGGTKNQNDNKTTELSLEGNGILVTTLLKPYWPANTLETTKIWNQWQKRQRCLRDMPPKGEKHSKVHFREPPQDKSKGTIIVDPSLAGRKNLSIRGCKNNTVPHAAPQLHTQLAVRDSMSPTDVSSELAALDFPKFQSTCPKSEAFSLFTNIHNPVWNPHKMSGLVLQRTIK